MPNATTLLRELKARPSSDRLLELLSEFVRVARRPRDLRALHELLLFHKAYPPSRAVRRFCERELRNFENRIAALDEEEREELAQSGIAGTRIYYPYDDPMTRWLHARIGRRMEVDWDAHEERDSDPLSELMPFLTVHAEADAVDDPEISVRDLVTSACGAKTSLAWLLERFQEVFPAALREHLYGNLQLPLSVELPAAISRTMVEDRPPARLFLYAPGERVTFDLMTEVHRPLRIPPPVPPARGAQLLDLVYATLLPRLRELYPATHGNPEEVYEVVLARGVRIVFWFMVPEYRLPLEAGWGLLVLKNGVPIGYGAGGMLQDRSEIAINVFDTFRGGEAGWLYSQYARLFNALCRAPWLVTRRYQIGYENEEGIASGAYWFYDKLGFRSVDAEIRELADAERRKIAADKGYRSPRRVLKKLCQADVVLSLRGEPPEHYREFPLGKTGLLAAQVIAKQFDGRREGLDVRVLRELERRLGFAMGGLSAAERAAAAQLGLFVLGLKDVEKWPVRDRRALAEFCRLKGSAREADYARAFQKNRRFLEALRRAAES